MRESQEGREKAWKRQGSGLLLEAESGGESSQRVGEVGKAQGLGLRLRQAGLGWQSLHSLKWHLDLKGPRTWKPTRERWRAITHLLGGWEKPLPTPYGQQASCFLTLSFHRQEEESRGPFRTTEKRPQR